jgi:hypothetical protein
VVRPGNPQLIGPTVYVTASAEQANQLKQGIDEADAIRYQAGLPPLDSTVWQIPDNEEAMTVRQLIAGENRTRAGLGLLEIQLVDVRTAPATDTTPSRSQRAIADENSLRVSLGLPEIETPASDAAARRAIADENQLRASLSLPELPETN